MGKSDEERQVTFSHQDEVALMLPFALAEVPSSPEVAPHREL